MTQQKECPYVLKRDRLIFFILFLFIFISFISFLFYYGMKKGKCIYTSDENMCVCSENTSSNTCQQLNGTFIQNQSCQENILKNNMYCRGGNPPSTPHF